MFDKGNLKYLLIWPITVILSMGLKIYAFKFPEILLINYDVIIVLVFGPALLVTIIVILKDFLKI